MCIVQSMELITHQWNLLFVIRIGSTKDEEKNSSCKIYVKCKISAVIHLDNAFPNRNATDTK